MRKLMRRFTILIFCLAVLSACKQKAAVSSNADIYKATSGNFHAVLMPVDEADLVEWDKPENEGPNIQFKKRATCGDKVALKIVFSGMGLTDKNIIDVTYDIEVLSPDGTSYSGGVHKDVPALKGVVLKPNNVFNNQGVLTLRFEPEDQTGKYDITATVRDNIGNHELTLKQSIELEDCE